MGLIDRKLNSGDIIRFEKGTGEHIYNIVYSHGVIQLEYCELSKLFIKDYGKVLYCNSIYSYGNEYQLYKLDEEDFYRLVKNKEFTVYIDDHVYTMKSCPTANQSEEMKNILNGELYNVSLTSDSRFIKAQCMQFEELIH